MSAAVEVAALLLATGACLCAGLGAEPIQGFRVGQALLLAVLPMGLCTLLLRSCVAITFDCVTGERRWTWALLLPVALGGAFLAGADASLYLMDLASWLASPCP